MRIEILKALHGKALPQFKFFDLSKNALGAPEAAAIAQNLTSLRSLDISWNQIGAKGAQYIAKNLKSLTFLNIAENEIKSEGARYLAQLPALTSLDSRGN